MEKVGRNDPCPCGSGKKFKQCCISKTGGSGVKRKLTAKWLNPKQQPKTESEKEEVDLMERTFGHAAHSSEGAFQAIMPKVQPEKESTSSHKEKSE